MNKKNFLSIAVLFVCCALFFPSNAFPFCTKNMYYGKKNGCVKISNDIFDAITVFRGRPKRHIVKSRTYAKRNVRHGRTGRSVYRKHFRKPIRHRSIPKRIRSHRGWRMPSRKIEYYVNTYGNIIQTPTHYSSRPSGATARCCDGTYSFSQSRRGTCSHHGGVAEWF